MSSNVTYSASDITNYTLQVTYANGKTGLTNGTATLTGAGTSGVVGSKLADNTWGFAWGATSTANSSMTYYTVPTYNTKGTGISTGRLENGTADVSSTTKKIVFAAKFAANNTSTGHYTTQALLSLVATPKQTFTLSYNANSGTGAPSNQSCTTTSSSPTSCNITTSSTVPTRSGYTFKGWANSSTATSADYSANQSIPMTTSKTLHAVWAVTINNITNMQQMTTAVCTASAVGDEATLTDTRDSSTYTVKKLQDGKCWMTQNLRIVNYTTKADDSQTGGYTIPASNTSGFSSDTASNAYYGNNTTYGAYYTWCAATAGTCTSATTDKAEASGSICPKGWRLPKGTPGKGTNEFANMAGIPTTTNITAGSNFWSNVPTKSFASSTLTLRDSAWPAAGYYVNSSPNYVGSYGHYWSSTASSSANAYLLYFGSSNFYPASNVSRRYGYSVRCVAE